jgi:hypothetical protein
MTFDHILATALQSVVREFNAVAAEPKKRGVSRMITAVLSQKIQFKGAQNFVTETSHSSVLSKLGNDMLVYVLPRQDTLQCSLN